MYRTKRRWQFWSFIGLMVATTIALLIMNFVYVPLAVEGMENVWNLAEWKMLFVERAPYICQAFLNLLLFIIICGCGAAIYSTRIRTTKSGLLIIAAISCISAVLLHTMVYGVDLIIPSTYSLFSPYHRSFLVFGGALTPITFENVLINNLFSIVIHIFAPQVILGLFVSALSMKKYKLATKE